MFNKVKFELSVVHSNIQTIYSLCLQYFNWLIYYNNIKQGQLNVLLNSSLIADITFGRNSY